MHYHAVSRVMLYGWGFHSSFDGQEERWADHDPLSWNKNEITERTRKIRGKRKLNKTNCGLRLANSARSHFFQSQVSEASRIGA